MGQVLLKIQTGEPLWLEVAKKLTPATDAANLGLYLSLAIALTQNPGGVLSMVGGKDEFALNQVCELRFIESDDKTDREHVRKVRAALRRVVSPALADKKANVSGSSISTPLKFQPTTTSD
jgi:hypothetical protein